MEALSLADWNDLGAHYRAIDARIPLRPIASEADYDSAVAAMEGLIDFGAGREDHPLAGLLGPLGTLIGDYEAERHRLPAAAPTQVPRWLMERHGLRQTDLPEIGSQGVVSEVLSGKRSLNAAQIKRLSERFGIGGSAFL